MSIVDKMQAALKIIEEYELKVISVVIDKNDSYIHLENNKEIEKFGELVQVIERDSIYYPKELVVVINGIKIISLVIAGNVGAAS